MLPVYRMFLVLICMILGACGNYNWVEWEEENIDIHGVKFEFLAPMCLIEISQNNPYTSLNVDISLGKVIDLASLSLEDPKLHSCTNLASSTYTTVSSFYSRYSWWLVGAEDFKFFIVEDDNEIRYLVPTWALTQTTNEGLNLLSQ